MEVSNLMWEDDTDASDVPPYSKGMVLIPTGGFQMGSNEKGVSCELQTFFNFFSVDSGFDCNFKYPYTEWHGTRLHAMEFTR